MRKTLSIALLLNLSALFSAGSALQFFSVAPDTIPPPPPLGPLPLNGPGAACVGEASTFSSEVPVACSCQWSVNGVTQPDTTPVFTTTWTQQGLHTVRLDFVCGGLSYPSDSIAVQVSQVPVQPGPIQGPEEVCSFTGATYSVAVGPFDTCQWSVNGVIQAATGPTMTYYFGAPGLYEISVLNFNRCGIGNAVSKQAQAVSLPNVFLGNDTTILQGDYLMLDAENPGCTYLWSTGETTRVIWVNTAGLYRVDVSDACGTVSDEIMVSVMVGTEENYPDHFAPRVIVHGRELSFRNLPADLTAIIITDIAGKTLFEGLPDDRLVLNAGGLILVQFIARSGRTTQKIMLN